MDEARKTETETIIKEQGFRRIIHRKGKTKHQKTEIVNKNPEKVVLGKIGNMEFYCYPYYFPDLVFIGMGQESQSLDKYDLRKLFSIQNRLKWFLNGSWELEKHFSKTSKIVSGQLKKAYNLSLKKQKELKNERKIEPF